MDYKPQVEAIPNNQPLQKQLTIHERHRFDPRADCFYELFKTSLMLAAPHGETSTGHPQAKLLPVQEAAARALEATHTFFSTVEGRGWVVETPPLEELKGDVPTVGFRNP